MRREQIVEGVREREGAARHARPTARPPDRRRPARVSYFWALGLVKDKETRQTFDGDECETGCSAAFSPGSSSERGLICRADDRGYPVIQISPPLVARQAEFDQIAGILGEVLAEAWEQMTAGRGRRAVAPAGAPETRDPVTRTR